MRRRKRKTFEKRPVPPHEAAERVIEASQQPLATEFVHQGEDIKMRAIESRSPEEGDLEQTMKDYYAQTDSEGQGSVPKEPPDTNPMPLQHVDRRPKGPPKHNM
jgi:hypothetical protein